MGSPFYNKDKSKLQEKKMEKLPEIVVTANAKKFGGKQYGAAPKSEIKQIPKATSYQTTLPKAPQVKKMSLKPNYALPAKQIQVDYIPPRPLPNPPKAKEVSMKKNYTPKVPIIEAYTPPQFEGAKPLAQSNQKKIYSSFKEQMEQLKN